ncbi:MAG: hypothetical protein CMO55_23530 [Verrucomicrobiales bacterium]|nr:hypothetical protein [Verrucomicrobiales bacterium]
MVSSFSQLPVAASFAFANEPWAWTAGLFAVGSAIVLFLTYRNSPLRGSGKFFAILLKALGLALLALALLEPVHLEELPKKHSNDVVILADNSAGLSVPLAEDETPPSDLLKNALLGDSPDLRPAWIEKINDTFRLQNYRFDRGLSQDEEFAQLTFDKNSSAVVSALSSIATRFEKRPIAATVLFTDGNATDQHLLESYLESVDGTEEETTPVYPVLVGGEASRATDIALTRVDATTTQFEDAQVTIQADIEIRGDLTNPVEVYVTNEKGEELETKQIVFPEDSDSKKQTTRIRLGAVPPGISFLNVGVRQTGENPQDELTDLNNVREISVNRGNGPYRILYVSGRPNWEYKFIRRSLSQDAELDLVGLIRIAKREPKFEWRGRVGESSNPLFRGFNKDIPEETQQYDEPVLVRLNTASAEELRGGFPSSAEELFPEYRSIILDDLEESFFTQEQQELIDRFVAARGGTLVMLGGQESFQQGGWDNTAVGRILPVYLDQLGGGGPALDATYNLSREGWLEPWMRLEAGQEQETTRLAYMPPFFSINKISAIKPGASILATVTDSEGRTIPAVVTQRYGSGKTAAIPVGDFWRWGMKDSDEQEKLAKSWRQMLRWSVSEVPGRVEVEKQEVTEGALPVTRVSVRVRNEAFEPQDDATVLLEVKDHKGNTKALSAEPSLEDPGLFTAEYVSEEEGGYEITATAIDGSGIEIGSGSIARSMNPAADEFFRLGPNPEFLQKIADATGGKLLTVDEVDQLPDLLTELNLPIMEVRQHPLWHAPWLFLLALLCFLGEWGLRRRQGVL